MPEIVWVRCVREVPDIYANYRPEPGRIYEAVKGRTNRKQKEFVILPIRDKQIVLRLGEFEYMGV